MENRLQGSSSSGSRASALAFRLALFTAAASLAVYIPYKFLTELHAIAGMYAFLFPLAPVLAVAGMVLAVRPSAGCDCGVGVRSGVGALSLLWLATGMLCAKSLAAGVMTAPLAGLFATSQMLLQHVFLSLAVLAFAWRPVAMTAWLKHPRVLADAACAPRSQAIGDAAAHRVGH